MPVPLLNNTDDISSFLFYRQGSQHYNRKFKKELPTSQEGEEGKYICDIQMGLDTFCQIFHTRCPEYNLIDSFQRGRVKATLFGEGDMTGANIIQNLEHYFMPKIRGGPMDRMIVSLLLLSIQST